MAILLEMCRFPRHGVESENNKKEKEGFLCQHTVLIGEKSTEWTS